MSTHDVKSEIDKGLRMLRTLRDEARVQLHLASLEAKSQWDKLQPKLDAAESAAAHASEATRQAIADAVKAVKDFHTNIKK
jgi:hypothetical protein